MDSHDGPASPADVGPAGPLVLGPALSAPTPSAEAAAALDALARLMRPDDGGLAALDRRLTTALAMQGQIIEALLAEKDRQDAEALVLADRLERIEAAAGPGDALGDALRDCSARLSDVLLHLEADAADRLPAGGRPLRAALAGLAAQIADLDAHLRGAAREGAPEAPPDAPPEAMRLAVAQALGPDPWEGAAA